MISVGSNGSMQNDITICCKRHVYECADIAGSLLFS
jgi:hypothetical protein